MVADQAPADDGHSTPPPPPRTSLDVAEGLAATGGTTARDERIDEDNEEDDRDNVPLLSSLFQKSVRVGPFSIRYNNSASPKSKPRRLYEGPSTRAYHDFDNDPLTCTDDEGGTRDDDEFRRGSRTQRLLRSLLSRNCCQRFLPLRILLLALYLAFTLASFWILDSIKEPTLAILVDGELGKHQPRAKMASFAVVVGLAVVMEWTNMARQRRRRKRQLGREEGDDMDANAAIEKSWADRDLPRSMRDEDEGSNRWKKMGVQTGNFFRRQHRFGDDDDTGNSSSKITTLAFYVVGSLYIHFFITVAVALQAHPSFRSKAIFHDADSVDNTGDAETPKNWVAMGYFLFALIESFGSVSITIFWAFANSHLTLETAERHYGSVVALAQIGAISGSTLSAVLGRKRDQSLVSDEEGRVDVYIAADVDDQNDAQVTPLLIFWACGCIGAGMAIMALYAQLFSKPMHESTQGLAPDNTDNRTERIEDSPLVQSKAAQSQKEDEGSGHSILRDLFGGVRMIFQHKYLTLVLLVSILYEVALTCMHYEMNLLGLDRFGVGISIMDGGSGFGDEHSNSDSDTEEGTSYIQFLGYYGTTVNVLSLFLSFYAFPRLIKNYGLRITIRIFPTVLLLVTIFAFVLFPRNLYFLFIALSVCKALTYSVHDPSEEVLYMPTSDDAKFRAKFWIDVVGQRIAKACGSAVTNYAGSVEGIVKYGSLPSVVASLALWFVCYQVGVMFDSLIGSGTVVGLKEGEGEGEEDEYDLELREGSFGDEKFFECEEEPPQTALL
ncbi:hypothetical protein ACHAXT_009102 [Thalassiosira profunda]